MWPLGKNLTEVLSDMPYLTLDLLLTLDSLLFLCIEKEFLIGSYRKGKNMFKCTERSKILLSGKCKNPVVCQRIESSCKFICEN